MIPSSLSNIRKIYRRKKIEGDGTERTGGQPRTRLLELLEQLVVLAAQLRPLRELVLAARRVELLADPEELRLRLLPLAQVPRGLRRQRQIQVPHLKQARTHTRTGRNR